jgi:hypothetical protein
VTPARLEMHENALVGLDAKVATVIGSYAYPQHAFFPSPSNTPEVDYEEDLFGAIRFLGRGQGALLVPLVQTYRSTPTTGAHFGGGIGDVNVSARYDFLLAGESLYVPGIALLAGVTLPTGKDPDQATQPLAVDATGIGAFQFNGAIALEQAFGPWLLNATVIVAKRTEQTAWPHEVLGTQFTFLAAGAYSFPNDMALALSVSYATEGDGTIGGADAPGSAKSVTVVTASGLWPITDNIRLLAGVYIDPPLGALGSNEPAQLGATITGIRSWM